MKIYEAEVAPSGKTRICFSIGYEEIELLYGLLAKAKQSIAATEENHAQEMRMQNMMKAMGVYLGKVKEKTPKSSEYPCPKCNKKLRGEKAVANHIVDVHGKENL